MNFERQYYGGLSDRYVRSLRTYIFHGNGKLGGALVTASPGVEQGQSHFQSPDVPPRSKATGAR